MNIPVRFVIIVKWNKIRFPSFLVYTIINWTMLSSRSVKHLHIKTGFCSVLYVCLYVQCESHIVYFQYFFILVFLHHFVELGGGVDDVSGWCRDGAYVELGFQWRWWLTDMTVFLIVCSSDSWFHSLFGSCLRFIMIITFCIHHLDASRSVRFGWLQDRSGNHHSDSIGENYFMCR